MTSGGFRLSAIKLNHWRLSDWKYICLHNYDFHRKLEWKNDFDNFCEEIIWRWKPTGAREVFCGMVSTFPWLIVAPPAHPHATFIFKHTKLCVETKWPFSTCAQYRRPQKSGFWHDYLKGMWDFWQILNGKLPVTKKVLSVIKILAYNIISIFGLV